jgi:hypothetical protein
MNKDHVFGPNFRKLVIHKMSMDAIPSGGGFADGIKFLTNPDAMKGGWQKAQEWCEAAIYAIRNAAEPNSFKDASEEDICAELLRMIEARKKPHETR